MSKSLRSFIPRKISDDVVEGKVLQHLARNRNAYLLSVFGPFGVGFGLATDYARFKRKLRKGKYKSPQEMWKKAPVLAKLKNLKTVYDGSARPPPLRNEKVELLSKSKTWYKNKIKSKRKRSITARNINKISYSTPLKDTKDIKRIRVKNKKRKKSNQF
jgi:hypothetical protein